MPSGEAEGGGQFGPRGERWGGIAPPAAPAGSQGNKEPAMNPSSAGPGAAVGAGPSTGATVRSGPGGMLGLAAGPSPTSSGRGMKEGAVHTSSSGPGAATGHTMPGDRSQSAGPGAAAGAGTSPRADPGITIRSGPSGMLGPATGPSPTASGRGAMKSPRGVLAAAATGSSASSSATAAAADTAQASASASQGLQWDSSPADTEYDRLVREHLEGNHRQRAHAKHGINAIPFCGNFRAGASDAASSFLSWLSSTASCVETACITACSEHKLEIIEPGANTIPQGREEEETLRANNLPMAANEKYGYSLPVMDGRGNISH